MDEVKINDWADHSIKIGMMHVKLIRTLNDRNYEQAKDIALQIQREAVGLQFYCLSKLIRQKDK